MQKPIQDNSPAVNQAAIVAEVSEVFMQYEAALLAHDVKALNNYFWDSMHTVRYGLAEHSYGSAAIHAYRAFATPVDPRRKLHNTVITTIGNDVASVCTEFSIPGAEKVGRQTQTWMRCADGWKIVAAHVSAISL